MPGGAHGGDHGFQEQGAATDGVAEAGLDEEALGALLVGQGVRLGQAQQGGPGQGIDPAQLRLALTDGRDGGGVVPGAGQVDLVEHPEGPFGTAEPHHEEGAGEQGSGMPADQFAAE
nr:hypothetical protein BJQ95_01133 [Cryobacterium sp. SO1]